MIRDILIIVAAFLVSAYGRTVWRRARKAWRDFDEGGLYQMLGRELRKSVDLDELLSTGTELEYVVRRSGSGFIATRSGEDWAMSRHGIIWYGIESGEQLDYATNAKLQTIHEARTIRRSINQ